MSVYGVTKTTYLKILYSLKLNINYFFKDFTDLKSFSLILSHLLMYLHKYITLILVSLELKC